VCNPLEAADSPHNQLSATNATEASPGLTNVQFMPGATATTADQILYSFDRVLQAATAAPPFPASPSVGGFGFYLSDGTEQICGAGPLACSVLLNSNGYQVTVTVGTTSGRTLGAVGAFVTANTVEGQNSVWNGDDEFGAANPNNSGSSVTPGTVSGPQLQSAHVSSTNPLVVVYTFTQSVTSPSASGFHVYDADGTELTCTGTPSVTNNNQVTCNGFVQGGGSAGSTPPTAAQAGGVALGAVDYKSVNVGSGNVNPEGGVATS
jgi:hypothetical protein